MYYRWKTKVFKTKEELDQFVSKHSGKIQWVLIFVNNGYSIEYRKLRRVY